MTDANSGEHDPVVEEHPHLMIIAYIQEVSPDLKIMESWVDSIKTLNDFGFVCCPDCNSDPRNIEGYSTCQTCRLTGCGPVFVPSFIENFGQEPQVLEEEEEV